MADKEIVKLIKELERQGWRVERGSKHFIAYSPDTSVRPITIPGTPSDHRSLKNLRAELRRGGAIL